MSPASIPPTAAPPPARRTRVGFSLLVRRVYASRCDAHSLAWCRGHIPRRLLSPGGVHSESAGRLQRRKLFRGPGQQCGEQCGEQCRNLGRSRERLCYLGRAGERCRNIGYLGRSDDGRPQPLLHHAPVSHGSGVRPRQGRRLRVLPRRTGVWSDPDLRHGRRLHRRPVLRSELHRPGRRLLRRRVQVRRSERSALLRPG